MQRTYRVAVLIETSRSYGRGLLKGVAKYNREHGRWAIYFEPQGLDEPPPTWLKDWDGDGILARIANRKMASAVLRTGLPVVELRGALSNLPVPLIGVDNLIVARLALDHLLERGLRQFAFCGVPRGEYERMDERCDHFVELVEAAGFRCDVFRKFPPRRRIWDEDQKRLAEWVKSLPKPIGIMTCNDDCGLKLLSACRRAAALVPEQVAVISVDNDEYLCTLAMPPLSSIDIPSQRIGYEAALLLDRMMAGEAAMRKSQLLIPPNLVVVRQSTNVLATEDLDIVRAVAFIRARACERLKIADVVRHTALSRAALEMRLKAILGRTIHQEIQHVQVEKIKDLLGDTDLSLKQIARRCGFRYTQHMARVFRRVNGQTLTQFRHNRERN